MFGGVAGKTKPKRVWIYVGSDDETRIEQLLKRYPHISEASAMATLLSAALRACEREGFASLPNELAVVEKPRSEEKPARPAEKTR